MRKEQNGFIRLSLASFSSKASKHQSIELIETIQVYAYGNMPRAQDRKVWNEDLVRALTSRYEMAVRQEKRDQFLWRDGAKQIEAVRKDIYTFSTGRVVNLPQNLKKRVFELCMDVIQGRKEVLPHGYAQEMTSIPAGQQQENPFERHPYFKTIKARSGSYAILMAFHHSTIKTLSKDEICLKAQPFCDTDMEPNFHAGRMHGAWSSNKTLLKHGLINQTGGGAQYVDGVGFRGQKSSYTLTRDGEQFIECMLRKFPQGATGGAAARAAAPVNNTGQLLSGANIKRSPFRTPNHTVRPTSGKASRNKELAQGDGEKLLNWIITTAQVGDTMIFKIGKARRKQLHDACDALEQELPGLKLHHSSAFETDTSNRRVLTVRVIQRPHGHVAKQESSVKRSLFGESHGASSANHVALDALGASPAKRSRPDIPASVAAAQAALQRQAIYESKLLESDRMKSAVLNIDDSDDGDDEEIKRAIELSRATAPKPHEFAITEDDGFEDEELKRAIELSQQSNEFETDCKPRALTEIDGFDAKEVKRAMDFSQEKSSRKGSLPIPRQSVTRYSPYSPDSDEDDLLNCGPTFGARAKKSSATAAKRRESPAKRALFRQEPDNKLIELLSDSENTPVECNPEESIIIDSGAGSRRIETISLAREDSKRPAIDQKEVIDVDDNGSENDDSIIEILEDSQENVATALAPRNNSGLANQQLTLLIDNRERNRNDTPRHLRMELTRLVKEGALKSVWPRDMPVGNVEESGLALGDFAFEIQWSAAAGRKRLPVVVERKRVSDLVQRSAAGDHWKQYMLMRDNCMHSIFLIETDTRSAVRFTAFGTQELEEWNPTCTLIDNERSIFLFFGRALLSSPSANFIQTKDETSSLRSVAALGVMAAASAKLRSKAAKACPPGRNNSTRLVDRLTGGGIPWELSRQIADSVGSIQYLEWLYKECESDECRSQLLVPFITESEYNGQSNTVADWSTKIFRVFRTSFTRDPHLSCTDGTKRRVTIELSKSNSSLFPAATDDSFYLLKLRQGHPLGLALPTVSMQTAAGKFTSHRLYVHLLEAKSLVTLITSRIHESHGDFVRIAKEVASVINSQCHHPTMVSGKDRRVLLLCGLNPAIDAAAKKAGYRTETRVVVDLVLAELMLSQNLCVIQAVRLKGDTELILQLLSLACFHYHLLFQEGDEL
jgi:hypothetical protein